MELLNDFINIHINKIKIGAIIGDYYYYYDLDNNFKFKSGVFYNNIDLIFKHYKRTRNDSKFSDSYNMYRNARFSNESNITLNNEILEDEIDIIENDSIWEQYYDSLYE